VTGASAESTPKIKRLAQTLPTDLPWICQTSLRYPSGQLVTNNTTSRSELAPLRAFLGKSTVCTLSLLGLGIFDRLFSIFIEIARC
jgi:hypothetical protein